MPLAVSLLAHLADSEGCSNILSRWKDESTSMVSEGYDKRSNLDISISLSLSSPRLKSVPHSHMLLSLLSMLPDGLSDVELVQSSLPINDILACKAALIRTTLAYQDGSQRLKALVPIREFVCGHQPAGDYLLQPLRQHFQRLLELYIDPYGTPSNSPTVARISLNFANLQSVLRNGLQQHHPDLTNSVYCALHLNVFSRVTGRGTIPLLGELHNILAHSSDHRLRVYFITELFASYQYYFLANPEAVVAEALKCFEQFDDPDLECGISAQSFRC
jgi:hypothetical protein